MGQTTEGAAKAMETIRKRHGKDFHQRIGRKGGLVRSKGGFGTDKKNKNGLTGKEQARLAGQKGGKITKQDYNVKT